MTATDDITLSPDEEFDLWVQRLPKGALLCRANLTQKGHKFPEVGDPRATAARRDNVTTVEAPCLRRCGTTLLLEVDPQGYVTKRRMLHYGNSKYRIPKEARDGLGLTRKKNARMRQELLIRNAEWITDDYSDEES